MSSCAGCEKAAGTALSSQEEKRKEKPEVMRCNAAHSLRHIFILLAGQHIRLAVSTVHPVYETNRLLTISALPAHFAMVHPVTPQRNLHQTNQRQPVHPPQMQPSLPSRPVCAGRLLTISALPAHFAMVHPVTPQRNLHQANRRQPVHPPQMQPSLPFRPVCAGQRAGCDTS